MLLLFRLVLLLLLSTCGGSAATPASAASGIVVLMVLCSAAFAVACAAASVFLPFSAAAAACIWYLRADAPLLPLPLSPCCCHICSVKKKTGPETSTEEPEDTHYGTAGEEVFYLGGRVHFGVPGHV